MAESDQTDESVDAEAALYIKKLHQNWANVKLIRPKIFVTKKNDTFNKEPIGEFWVETTTHARKLQWLAAQAHPDHL